MELKIYSINKKNHICITGDFPMEGCSFTDKSHNSVNPESVSFVRQAFKPGTFFFDENGGRIYGDQTVLKRMEEVLDQPADFNQGLYFKPFNPNEESFYLGIKDSKGKTFYEPEAFWYNTHYEGRCIDLANGYFEPGTQVKTLSQNVPGVLHEALQYDRVMDSTKLEYIKEGIADKWGTGRDQIYDGTIEITSKNQLFVNANTDWYIDSNDNEKSHPQQRYLINTDTGDTKYTSFEIFETYYTKIYEKDLIGKDLYDMAGDVFTTQSLEPKGLRIADIDGDINDGIYSGTLKINDMPFKFSYDQGKFTLRLSNGIRAPQSICNFVLPEIKRSYLDVTKVSITEHSSERLEGVVIGIFKMNGLDYDFSSRGGNPSQIHLTGTRNPSNHNRPYSAPQAVFDNEDVKRMISEEYCSHFVKSFNVDGNGNFTGSIGSKRNTKCNTYHFHGNANSFEYDDTKFIKSPSKECMEVIAGLNARKKEGPER